MGKEEKRMKRSMDVKLALFFLVFLSFPANAQEGMQGHIELSQAIVDQISTVLDADNVLGEPVIIQGKTIIPVVCMAFGFGSGRGMMEMHSGSGGGGGGMVIPVSMLVISPDGEFSVIEARKNQFTEMIKGISLAYMELMEKQSDIPDED
jgi:uncharacterized spore protein YtfJ